MKPYGDRLRAAMGEMTQDDLAKRSGVPQTTISNILLGADPRYSTVQALELALPALRSQHKDSKSNGTAFVSDRQLA